jgi:hypothetical protein
VEVLPRITSDKLLEPSWMRVVHLWPLYGLISLHLKSYALSFLTIAGTMR